VALSVARRLKDAGAWVWMLQRSDVRRSEIEGMMAVVVKGDATVRSDVDAAMEQIEDIDVVVSTIGGTPGDPTADSVGNINLIEAAAAKGVKKFVLVTSIGCGDSRDAPPAQVFDVLKPVLLEKDKAEAALRGAAATGMAHVIVRPGGLTNDPPTGTAVLTTDAGVCGAVSREDAAALVVKAALSGKAENVTLSLVDRGQLFKRDGKEPEFEDFVL
jgi:nucleoside-diphosphate-sugar epimerase